jgi:hypothetical protein
MLLVPAASYPPPSRYDLDANATDGRIARAKSKVQKERELGEWVGG